VPLQAAPIDDLRGRILLRRGFRGGGSSNRAMEWGEIHCYPPLLRVPTLPRDPAVLRRIQLGRICATLIGLACSQRARAEQNEAPVRIEYLAPAGCPTEEEFLVRVRARAPRVRRASEGDRVRTFVISIAGAHGERSGHLVVRDVDGKTADRDMVGNTCEEVVDALALITALAVERSALTSSPASAPLSPPPFEERPSKRSGGRWHAALTVSAGMVSGVVPNPVLDVALLLEVDVLKLGFLSPAVRAGFEGVDFHSQVAHFGWRAGVVEGCPTQWSYATLNLQPCVRVEAGILEGTGVNVTPARDAIRAWLAAGMVARAQWFFSVPLFVDVEAGLRFPLVRTRYFVQPDTTVHEPPSVGLILSAGLGVRFF
jgi:hypothetical protein